MGPRLRALLTAAGIGTAALLSLATSKPKEDGPSQNAVEPAYASYVGEWVGEGVTLTITQDGAAHYKKQEGTSFKEVNAVFKGVVGGKMILKAAFVDVSLEVNAQPNQTDGTWTMTLDKTELVKKAPFSGTTKGATPGESPKAKLEATLNTQFTAKGVTRTDCPDPTGKTTFTCLATLKNGKTAPITVTLKEPEKYGFKTDIVALEPGQMNKDVSDLVEKGSKGKYKLTVDCGREKVYIPLNESVTCTATDRETQKKGVVHVKYAGGDFEWRLEGL